MSFVVMIPARLASTRLPNKPLADIGGVPMVVRVAMQAHLSLASKVIVVAQDQAIVDAVKTAGFDALLTGAQHASGTDRLAEACESLNLPAQTVVVNVQGDEPLIDPKLIDAVAKLMTEDAQVSMSTACHVIHDADDFTNPNVVKVVLNHRNEALYFSRATIPFLRDPNSISADYAVNTAPIKTQLPYALRHVGIYAYRAGFLREFSQLSPAPIEQIESLEQLRALWFGHRIKLHICANQPAAGVDTPNDLERARAIFLASHPNAAN